MAQIQFDSFTKAEVLAKIFERWSPQEEVEVVAVTDALGRVAAEDIVSQINQPVVRSSMMDGYAVKASAFKDGLPDTSAWQEGIDYARADTGDDFDDRFDAVVKVEDIEVDSAGVLHFAEHVSVKPGSSVNKTGAILKAGDILHAKYTPVRSFDISAIASGGVTHISVIKKPRVAFIPTGSELIPAGQTPQRGQIIDSNSLLAQFALEELGAEPSIFPIVKDDPAQLESALEKALAAADIVIVNGGSSKGDEDFNTRLLASKGELLCHGVLAGPGRPLSAIIIDGKAVINAPGPSLALFHVLEWCIEPLIARALGTPARKRPTVQAVLTEDISKPPVASKITGGENKKAEMVGKGPKIELPDGKKFELLRKVKVTRTDNGYAAQPLSIQATDAPAWRGYSTGQLIGEPGPDQVKGSIVEVELLSPLEYL